MNCSAHSAATVWAWAVPIASLALLSACTVGPDYRRPEVQAAAAYKELGDWNPATPAEDRGQGPWWLIFKDEELNRLEVQIDISNQNVKAAADAYDQARAFVAQARAAFWPTVSASAGSQREAIANTPAHTTYSAGLTGNWDIDLWGSLRRSYENSSDSAQASAAALAAARLSAQAALATDYFALRAQDQLQRLLDDTVQAQQASLKITRSRFHFGVAAKADVVSAEAQLLSSRSLQVNAGIQRALLEHAIAVLTGRQPADFSLTVQSSMRTGVPVIPPGIPSVLLQRRPDIAQAERNVAAANASVGVAQAAYFPSLTLGASDQYSGGALAHLFSTPNRIWSFGPSLALSVIDGGLRRAQVAQARAAYEISVDNYRQTVLNAFQQVEDEIATLRILEQQAQIDEASVSAARQAEALTLTQYKAGTVPYSSVIAAQATRLASEQTALAVLSNRLQASVVLIEATGGGWQASQP